MATALLTRPSLLSRTDPRVRVVLAVLLAILVAPLQTVWACLAAFLTALLLLCCAKPYPAPLLSRFLAVNSFVLFLALVLPLSMPGSHLPAFAPVPVSVTGLRIAVLIAIKANTLFFAFVALLGSMDIPVLGYAMERLHIPPSLVFLFLFTVRFLETIGEEWKTLMTAARLRGFSLTTSRHCYRTLGALLGLLLVRSHQRGKRVQEAMLLRGFNGHFHSVARFRAGLRDVFLTVAVLLALTGILVIEFHSVLGIPLPLPSFGLPA